MADDLLPPLPPGQKRKEKSKGGFLGLFGKPKASEPSAAAPLKEAPLFKPGPQPTLQPAVVSKPAQEPVKPQLEEQGKKLGLEIDDLRKGLGLEAYPQEPPAFMPDHPVLRQEEKAPAAERKAEAKQPEPKPKQPAESSEQDELFDLPELDIPVPPKELEAKPDQAPEKSGLRTAPGEFSFRIASTQAATKEKEEKPFFSIDDILEAPQKIEPKDKADESWLKEPEPLKQAAKAKPGAEEEDWAKELSSSKRLKGKSDFAASFEEAKQSSDAHPEYLEELEPDEIKKSAREIKRKALEERKAAVYAPETKVIDAEPEDEDDTLMEESPQEEIDDIKRRLRMALGGKLRPEEEMPYEPPKIQITQMPVGPSKSSVLARETEERLADEIRQQERLRVEEKKELLEEQAADEKQKLNDAKKKLQETEKNLQLESEAKKKNLEEAEKKLQLEAEQALAKLKEQSRQQKAKLEEQGRQDKAKLDVQLKELKEKLEDEYNTKLSELEDARIKLEAYKEKMEKEKQELEQQKIMAAGQANKNTFKEKQLKAFEIEIDREKQELEKNKNNAEALIKKLPELRKEHDDIAKKMREMYERIQAYESRQKELHELDSEIRKNEQALIEAQQRLIATEARIKEKGFADYLAIEINQDTLVSTKFEEPDILRASNLEFYNLIDNCKSLVREKNIKAAKNSYMELRNAYNTLPVQGMEKDMIYTAIRELYDDIKLAEMEGR